jgi:uncharacterized membrane protein
MTTPLDYLPVLLILAYIPFMCWSDWKTRTFNFAYLIPLMVVEALLLLRYLDESPIRNYYLLALSAVLCLIPLVMALLGKIGGCDFWLIAIIMIGVQYNPFLFPRYWFGASFLFMLLLTMCYMPIITWILNYRAGNMAKRYSFLRMLNEWPGEFSRAPLILPISFAFIMAMVIDVLTYSRG